VTRKRETSEKHQYRIEDTSPRSFTWTFTEALSREITLSVRRSVMSRMLIAAILICAFAMPANGQYFSLWADEGRTTSEYWTESPFQAFTIYVFLDPGTDGAYGAEYKLTGPSGHFATGSRAAPFVTASILGNPYGAPGVSVGFSSCQSETVWLFSVDCMTASLDPGLYTIEENDVSSFRGIATCVEPYRPLVEAVAYNSFCYNTTDNTSRDTSWGAIKKQY
jgi:hypothetical protein